MGVQDNVTWIVKDNQPFLITQNAIAEIFKCVMDFCAQKRGNAINVAASLKIPDAWFISSRTG